MILTILKGPHREKEANDETFPMTSNIKLEGIS
jgi:hypothetical protein